MNKPLQTLEQQAAALKEKHAREAAQMTARLKDARARETKAERKRDTQRKIVMGALAGHHMTANPDSDFARTLMRLLDDYTYTPSHRDLFDLPRLPADEEKARRSRSKRERNGL